MTQFTAEPFEVERADRIAQYKHLRAKHPDAKPPLILAFLKDEENPLPFHQWNCRHEWTSGYDDSDHEIGIRCIYCGADGDA